MSILWYHLHHEKYRFHGLTLRETSHANTYATYVKIRSRIYYVECSPELSLQRVECSIQTVVSFRCKAPFSFPMGVFDVLGWNMILSVSL